MQGELVPVSSRLDVFLKEKDGSNILNFNANYQ